MLEILSTNEVWITVRILLALGTAVGLYFLPLEQKRIFLFSTAAVILFMICGYLLMINKAMGYSAIVFAPFFCGFLFVLIYAGFHYKLAPPNMESDSFLPPFVLLAIALPTVIVLLELIALFVFFLEGTICIIMAAPFIWIFNLMGSMLGYAVLMALKIKPKRNVMLCAFILGASPVITQPLETHYITKQENALVTTSIIINSSPEKIFQYVTSFPALPGNLPPQHPSELLFNLGLPAPTISTIACKGVTCARYCVFNQNIRLNERVTAYQPGRELAFDVETVVGPQNRITGVDVHVMPGGIYFNNRKGQFILTEIAPGKTLMQGTTWYTLNSSINWYARPWADFFLHTIHRRVLEHIKQLAETENIPTDKIHA